MAILWRDVEERYVIENNPEVEQNYSLSSKELPQNFSNLSLYRERT